MIPYRVYDQISIGPITIYTWGFFVGLGFIVGLMVALNEAKKRGIDRKEILNLAIFIFIGAVLGARLGHILQFIGGAPHTISGVVQYIFIGLFRIHEGGMMFYGGLIGAILFGVVGIRLGYFSSGAPTNGRGEVEKPNIKVLDAPDTKYRERSNNKKFLTRILERANIIVPGLALGLAIGRIGCILINEHQGALTSLPWAILWPDGALRHPVGVYLSLNALILFIFLKYFIKKNYFFIFLLWYSVSRFFLDFTRSQDTYLSDPHFWGLTTSQYISLTIMLILVIILIKKKLVFNK